MKIISFSGIDCSGKGTQIDLIKSFFNENNIKYKVIWARGTSTPGIEFIKNLVRKKGDFSEEQKIAYSNSVRSNPSKSKILLFLSILDFYWYFGIYYRLVYLFGKTLICDRYIWDALVDFRIHFSRFNFEKWLIWKMLLKIIPKPQPSFIFVLLAEQSISRGINKNEPFMDSIEIKTAKINEYLNLIEEGKWSCVIDGSQTIEAIHQSVKKELSNEN